jgi:flagellar biosynthesis/type III secretory pathway chaperone
MINLNTVTKNTPPTIAGLSQLREIVARLIVVLDEENQVLESNKDISLEPMIQKKGQLLLELMRAQKHMRPDMVRTEIRTDILRLRHAMSVNKQKLAIHFAATKDITDSLLDVLRQNESDGTYVGWSKDGRMKQ